MTPRLTPMMTVEDGGTGDEVFRGGDGEKSLHAIDADVGRRECSSGTKVRGIET